MPAGKRVEKQHEQRVVFLDRDGVINRRKRTLVKSWSEFKFLPGVKDSIKKLVENGYRIIVVTNQDVVGWGFISESKLNDIHGKMSKELESSGGMITDIFYCPHNPVRKCPCRKPKPGMLKDAAKKYEILPGSSWMVGDKLTDVQAGKAFGSRTILIKPGKRSTENKQVDKESSKEADFVVINLKEAVELILREDG